MAPMWVSCTKIACQLYRKNGNTSKNWKLLYPKRATIYDHLPNTHNGTEQAFKWERNNCNRNKKKELLSLSFLNFKLFFYIWIDRYCLCFCIHYRDFSTKKQKYYQYLLSSHKIDVISCCLRFNKNQNIFMQNSLLVSQL